MSALSLLWPAPPEDPSHYAHPLAGGLGGDARSRRTVLPTARARAERETRPFKRLACDILGNVSRGAGPEYGG